MKKHSKATVKSTLRDRHLAEERFHDQKAIAAPQKTFYDLGATRYAFERFLSIAGDLTNMHVLDLGCGTGWAAVHYAQKGASVTGLDISEASLRIAQEEAFRQGLSIRFVKGTAEDMDFQDAFDLVLGISVLHHTDLDKTAPALFNALKPRGRALFMEPLAHNPLINLFRRLTPSRRSSDERPLTLNSIERLSSLFSSVAIDGYGFLTLLAFGLLPFRAYKAFAAANRLLAPVENSLLSLLPSLNKYCWGAIIQLAK